MGYYGDVVAYQYADFAVRIGNANATLIIHSEKAHSRYFSEDAYKVIGSKNKELYIVPNATHTDLYDNRAGVIPYDKLEKFFKENSK